MEIQLLSKHWLSLRLIAAEVGCAVNTVRRHLAMKAVPKYERKVKRPSKLAAPWRGDIAAARPQAAAAKPPAARPAIVVERIAEAAPSQHQLAAYEQLLMNVKQEVAA